MTSQDAVRVLTGKVALVVMPKADGSVEYRFDDARPESRTARMVVDRVVQPCAGRLVRVDADDPADG